MSFLALAPPIQAANRLRPVAPPDHDSAIPERTLTGADHQDGTMLDPAARYPGPRQTVPPGGIRDDRIAVRPVLGQDLIQPRHGLIAQTRQVSPVREQRVGGDDRGPAGIADDRQSGSFRQALGCQDLGDIENVIEFRDPHDPGALEHRAIDGIYAGDGAGMGERGPGRSLEAARLIGDYRFGARERARRRHETARVPYGLDVENDGLGIRVGSQIIDQVAIIGIEIVPSEANSENPIPVSDAQSSTALERNGTG
jgi:hypothetical protein